MVLLSWVWNVSVVESKEIEDEVLEYGWTRTRFAAGKYLIDCGTFERKGTTCRSVLDFDMTDMASWISQLR